MAQDFAKQRPPQPQSARKNGKPASRPPQKRSAHWSWFFSGIIAGVMLTGAGYIGFLRYQAMNPVALDADNSAQAPAALPDFDFGFYNELATAEVTVSVPQDPSAAATDQPTQAAPPATQPATVASQTVNYLLQAGSFQAKQEADERRAKITLMNMAAEIVPGIVAGRTWYRVQVGPFAGRDNAEAARKELSANNIDSIPLLMR